MRKVYLDHNATTPIDPEVRDSLQPFLDELFGNSSSIHWAGREVRGYHELAREQVAALIHAEPEEIVFTSCGSESDNHAIKGAAYSRKNRGNHIITSTVEHQAVLNSCKFLEGQGYEVTYLSVDPNGRLNPEDVERAIREDTILITIMSANNETGTLTAIEEIGGVARKHGILFHSDMIQALGKVPIDVAGLHVDLASFSGHKLYAPKGVGALYVKNGVEIDALIHGGHQESSRRAGTENVMGIVAFGEACRIARREMDQRRTKTESLRQRLLEGILRTVDKVELNGDPVHRLPNTLNLSFEHVEAESFVIALDLAGIAVSSGSACSSGSTEASHVLLAMGINPVLCRSAVRFSLGSGNTEEDIDYTLSLIPGVVERLREMSPMYKG